jgi:2-polyprenyl-6-methoxyphenol hydroxylase-like FAD-dependent oxidoreductase
MDEDVGRSVHPGDLGSGPRPRPGERAVPAPRVKPVPPGPDLHPTSSMRETEVLIAGAGPTGLVLALWLARSGVRLRIVDKAATPGTTSRALVVQPRTLEFYRQLGLADAIVERGLEFAAVNLWAAGKKLARVEIGPLGEGLSPFPYMMVFPQDEHERLLIDRLRETGVEVERPVELLGFEQTSERVQARLRCPDGSEETLRAAYLAGCDGARSTVREALGAGFPGGTYIHLFYVADVDLTGPVANRELHIALDEADFLGVFPLAGRGSARLIGTVRPELENRHADLTWDDVSRSVVRRLGIEVERVNWFSTYHVHHRVAGSFRSGRVFLLGDAAHIHSPVGGQGMNTGIGDAVNLAWKLACVLSGRMDATVLDTYEPERIAFARRLVETTDRAFTVATSPGPLAKRVRLDVVPRLAPALLRLRPVRRYLFRTVSQVSIQYRKSRLSSGRAGSVHGGDRLPWVRLDRSDGAAADNFSPLASLDWQLHVYGDAAPALAEACRESGLPLHVFDFRGEARDAGLESGAAYLVRPDGHVAMADPGATAAELTRHVRAIGLRGNSLNAGGRVRD